MLRRTALCFALLMATPAISLAAEGKPGAKAPGEVRLAAVALPVVVNGRLINYVFVTVVLHLAAGIDPAVVRIKEPFFRDALVRAGHRNPYTVATDYTKVDDARIRAQVMGDATAILGKGVVLQAEVLKQVSQHHSDLPSPFPPTKRPELIP